MRTLILILVAGTLACASFGSREAPPPPGLAGITGIVLDSITRAGPLAGASVALPDIARFTVSDEQGRFRFDSLPPGRHTVVASHPALDSVRLFRISSTVHAPAGRVTRTVIATPPPAGIYASICSEDMTELGVDGVVLGTLRDVAGNRPLSGAELRIRWSELVLGDHLEEQVRAASVMVDSSGQFAICGAFADATLELQAVHGERRSGIVVLPGEGQVLRAADVVLGDGYRASPPLEVAQAEPVEILATDTLIAMLRADGPGVVPGRVMVSSGSLPGAVVELAGVALQERTNADGEFVLRDVPAGSHSLYVRALGYQPKVVPVMVGSGLGDTLVISLERAPNTLDVVRIIGRRSASTMALQEVHRRSQFGITKLLDIEHVQRVGLTAALRMQPFVNWLGDGTNRYVAFRVFGRYCRPTIMVDGNVLPMDMVNSPDGGGFDLDLWVHPSEIAAVEYVRGMPPAALMGFMRDSNGEMDPGGECGTIAIWRK